MKVLPTGKKHVSYSEIRCWKECGWRHKLLHIEKLDDDQISPYLDYGTIVHAACEDYLTTKTYDLDKVEQSLREAWAEKGFDSEEYIKAQTDRATSQGWTYHHEPLETWISWAKTSIQAVPNFLDENFPEWTCIKAEEELYEEVNDLSVFFKGFIDGVIKFTNAKGKERYLVLDWKTSKKYGWPTSKKREFLTQAQIILYKSFWCEKHGVDPKHVKCGFVLLKRGAKLNKSCAFVEVSAGPVAMEKARRLLNSMVKTVRKGMYLKNRDSCRFCAFKDTEHCQSW